MACCFNNEKRRNDIIVVQHDMEETSCVRDEQLDERRAIQTTPYFA